MSLDTQPMIDLLCRNKWIGVFMTPNGPIEVTPEMSKEDMWKVLEWALQEIKRRGDVA